MQLSNSAPDRRSGRSLAVRIGALTAAVSLMLAGGVAVAASASAKDNPNKGGNSGSAPGQQSAGGSTGAVVNDPNGGAVHGDNGGANTPGNNQNGNNGKGGTGTLSIDVCHATRSASNPYVLITVDFSSVDEAFIYLNGGKGNGHGDHVGLIWDGQRSGVNWGDIIESISGTLTDGTPFTYPGYNLGEKSAALGGTGAQILGNQCQGLKPLTDSISGCYTLTSADPAAYSKQTFSGAVGDQPNWTNTDGQKFSLFTASSDPSSTNSAIGCGTPCDPNTESCGGGFSAQAESAVALCVVTGDSYNGVTTVPTGKVNGTGASQTEANNNAQSNAEKAAVAKAQENSVGDNIIKPFTYTYASFAGYNWNAKTEARYNAGCSPNQTVISAVPLPATVAGTPKPAKVQSPASATMPGSVEAGGGSSAPSIPLWALALMVVGALGAAASGAQLMGNRK